MSEMINKHVQLLPTSRQEMVDWLEKAFSFTSNDTQMVSRSLVHRFLKCPKRIMRASTFKMMNKKMISLFYDFVLLYLWVF